MKKNKVILYVIAIVITILCTRNIYALDTQDISQELGLQEVVEELNKYVENLDLDDISADMLSGKGLDYSKVGNGIISKIKTEITSAIKKFIYVIIFVVIMAVIKAFELEKDSTISKVVRLVGILVIISTFLDTYMELVPIIRKTIDIESNIVQIVSPFIMSMLILTGAISTTGLIQPLILLLVGTIGFLVNNVIIPLITVSIVFSVITNISDGINFSKLSSMCNKSAIWINAIVLSIFLGFTSIQSAISTSVDELAIKTTQTAISNVIPVVRKICIG